MQPINDADAQKQPDILMEQTSEETLYLLSTPVDVEHIQKRLADDVHGAFQCGELCDS
ncbi:MAG: hypothetical protein ACOYK6_01615 [Chthoniobacterales bacterium]